MAVRLLVIEDERDLNDIITKRLRKAGYVVDSCSNGLDGWDYMMAGTYDAILLDIMIPEVSGLELLQRLRSQGNQTKVLLLTAKDRVEDRVKGLDSGADDYLVKPFDFQELLARIRALTRRTVGQVTNRYQIANLTVDCKKHEVMRGQNPIKLSSKEFALLEYLVRNQGVVLSRTKIEQNLFDFNYEGSSNVIDVYIRYLRKKIDEPYEPKLIHTVRGSGYVLKEEKV